MSLPIPARRCSSRHSIWSAAAASREAAEEARRRRRDPNDNGVVKRLSVPEDRLDRNQYHYRWVNDAPGRIDMLYRQDWDLVADDELGAANPSSRHADVAQNRTPLQARLMRKPKEFYDEDHLIRQKRIDDELKAAELGRKVLSGPDTEGLTATDPRVYSPNPETNKL